MTQLAELFDITASPAEDAGGRELSAIALWGNVTNVSPTRVRLAGDTVSIEITNHLQSYTPATNDRVILLRIGSAWIILGKLNA